MNLPSRLTRRLIPAALALGIVLLTGTARAQYSEEVPFVTSPDNVTLEMLRLARVGAGDHVIDLGSGDGRIVILAAKRFGATGMGVEIVPDLVERSNKSARDAGVADKVEFRIQDLFATDLSKATVITMYLLPEVNMKLRPAILQLKPGTRIVSHDWDMGDWQPDQTSIVDVPDKKVGREKLSRIHLWTVPARVDGTWCGSGPLVGASLRFNQQYQRIEGTLAGPGRERRFVGRIHGATLRTQAGRDGALEFTQVGDALQVTGGEGALAMAKGASFRRTVGKGCGA